MLPRERVMGRKAVAVAARRRAKRPPPSSAGCRAHRLVLGRLLLHGDRLTAACLHVLLCQRAVELTLALHAATALNDSPRQRAAQPCRGRRPPPACLLRA